MSVTGCGPLRHTSSARPRSAFLSAPVFSRKPRSLCRKPARHKMRKGCCLAMLPGSGPQEHRKQVFPERKYNTQGAGPNGDITLKAGLGESGSHHNRDEGAQPKKGGYLGIRGVSRSEGRHLVSAAAPLTSRGWRGARGPLLHLRLQT